MSVLCVHAVMQWLNATCVFSLGSGTYIPEWLSLCNLHVSACARMPELFKSQQDAGICFQVQNTSQVAVAAP